MDINYVEIVQHPIEYPLIVLTGTINIAFTRGGDERYLLTCRELKF
jgi:hypothetical protein